MKGGVDPTRGGGAKKRGTDSSKTQNRSTGTTSEIHGDRTGTPTAGHAN
jgi:hypothetical protein